MAESTEDLRREMEEFERIEADPQVEATAPLPVHPGKKMIPAWVYGMIAADIVIVLAVLFYFVV